MAEDSYTPPPAQGGGMPPRESGGSVTAEGQPKAVQRETPQPDPARIALVKQWCKAITDAKEKRKDVFGQMREGAAFAAGKQWPGQMAQDDRYRANLTLRHINQRVASIYAKNPRVRAKRRDKIWYTVGDGTPEQLAQAQAAVMLDGNPLAAEMMAAQGIPPPSMEPNLAQQIVAEAMEVAEQKRLYGRMGRTLELVAHYSMEEQHPKFKDQLKQLVRRALTCKAGYIKVGYQRVMGYGPDIASRIKDLTDQLREIERLAADVHDGEVQPESAEAEKLRLDIAALTSQRDVVMREGLVFSFPKAWSLIVPMECSQLKGFVNAPWLAEEFIFTPDQVQKIYRIDPQSSFEAHTAEGQKDSASGTNETRYCAVYQVYDLEAQTCFTVLLGYPDFLKEPGVPDVQTEQFHPYHVLAFNDVEDPECIYPPSNVELVRPMAVDYNRGREGLRVHRQANVPGYGAPKGAMDDDTFQKLGNHAPHEVIQHNLGKDVELAKVVQPLPKQPIQPELYDVEHCFIDIQRVVGDQAADVGGTQGDTATEVTVAANSRATGIQSDVDELDEFLTDVWRTASDVLLMQMSKDTATRIAGPGAAWPDSPDTRQTVAEDLHLEVRAGSSGRPNRQGRLMAIEKTGPFLLQNPGVKPRKLAEFMLQELDESIEVDEFLDDSLPSITAMNAMAKPNLAPGPGNEAQGEQGKMNAPAPAESGGKMQNMGGRPPMVKPIGFGTGV